MPLTCSAVSFSLLLSGPLLELHLTKVHNGASTLVHTVLLLLGKAQNVEGILQVVVIYLFPGGLIAYVGKVGSTTYLICRTAPELLIILIPTLPAADYGFKGNEESCVKNEMIVVFIFQSNCTSVNNCTVLWIPSFSS